MEINLNEIKIQSAHQVSPILLINFYKEAYPERAYSLISNWKWLYRTVFIDNKIPIVLVYRDKIIAHLGTIPVKLSVGGDLRIATFLMDFQVLNEFRRSGLGSMLTHEYGNLFECFIGLSGNEKSINHLKKFGFIELFDTFMHINFIRPFNYPRLINLLSPSLRKILNGLTYPFLYLIYSIFAYNKIFYTFEKLNNESFNDFFKYYNSSKKTTANTISPVRDQEYCEWRILNSPNLDNYFIYKTANFSALISLEKNNGSYIDVLWVLNTSHKKEIVKMLSTLGIYGMKNGFSYVRFYTSRKELSVYIKRRIKSFIQHPRAVYFSKDPAILDKFNKSVWDLQLIDSDFEKV